jgi:hypothetical protein
MLQAVSTAVRLESDLYASGNSNFLKQRDIQVWTGVHILGQPQP